MALIEEIKVIQHNVLKWTPARATELGNTYAAHNPDVVLLNATGMKNTERIKLFPYTVYQRNTLNDEHAGVAIAIRNNVKHTVYDDFVSDTLAVKIMTSHGPLMLATSYIPPRIGYANYEDFNKLMQQRMPTYMLGDLNANHPNFGYARSNATGRLLQTFIRDGKTLHLGPDYSTMVRGRGRPDIALCNAMAHLNFNIQPGEVTTSDHLFNIITISTKAIVSSPRTTRKIKETDWDAFAEEATSELRLNNRLTAVSQSSQTTSYTEAEINENLNEWMEIVKTVMERKIPVKSIKLQVHYKKSDLLKLCETRYKELIRRAADRGLTREERDGITEIQDRIREESKRLSTEKWNTIIEKLDIDYNDQSKFWKKIRQLKGGKDPPAPYLVNRLGDKIRDIEGMTELLTETWSNVFRISDEDNESFDEDNEELVNDFIAANRERTQPYSHSDLSRLAPDSQLTAPVTTADVKRIIKNFKNKAPGISGITKRILEHLPEDLIAVFTILTNHAISMGAFPYIYKSGEMALLGKEGKDARQPSNYRPITLLEVPGKIIEKIISERLINYCEETNRYHPMQFGFRKGRSTISAIANVYEAVALSQRRGAQCNVVCRDVAKAFDKVWHQGLRYKILHLELPSIIERILCHYTYERKARIKFRGQRGEFFELESGVPQGSILAPTLYSLYTADMPPPSPGNLDVVFADDVTQVIVEPNRSKQFLANKTEREIERINDYEAKWKIKTSTQKFQLLSVSKIKPNAVFADGEEIQFTRQAKTLGLSLTRTGIVPHVKSRLGRAKRERQKLRRFGNLSPHIRLRLYKTLIRPILEYPVLPMCIMAQYNIRAIQAFQNTSLKQAVKGTEIEDLTAEELHERLEIEPFNIRQHKMAVKAWDRAMELELERDVLRESVRETEEGEGARDHLWWRRVHPYTSAPEPTPYIVA